jgi:hypothetical protein
VTILVTPREHPAVGPLARGYAFVVVSLRLVIIAGWAAAVASAIVFLPPLNPTTCGLSELIPPGSPAAHAEGDASRLFGFPLDAAVAVVQRDLRGLPAATQVRAVRQALAADREVPGQLGQLSRAAQAAGLAEALARADRLITAGSASPGPPGGIPGLAGAFALPNTAGLLAGTAEHSTAIITFLYFQPGASFGQQTAGANEYVHWYLNQPTDHVIGVTGPVPAEYAQSQIIQDHVFWVELFTVLAIALILGLRFRSAGRARDHGGDADPAGVVPAFAAPGASRAITTAGAALAASFAMLAVIPLEQFRQLAITMAVGVILDAIAVRSLLVPALVALFGRLGMWPAKRSEPRVRIDPLVSAGQGLTRVDPADGGQPGLGGRDAEGIGVELEGGGPDGGDRPAVAEGSAQLVLADPARAEHPGLPVAEAHQVQAAARPQHRGQAGDVPGPVVVVEDVEHPAVDDGVEVQPQLSQAPGVGDLEAGPDPAGGCLAAGDLESQR